jgi:hypothetical protein
VRRQKAPEAVSVQGRLLACVDKKRICYPDNSELGGCAALYNRRVGNVRPSFLNPFLAFFSSLQVCHNHTHIIPGEGDMQERNGSVKPMAVSSSLNSIRITPRTPKTPRSEMRDGDDDLELSLLDDEERIRSARDFGDDASSVTESESDLKKPISAKDKRQMVLLCVLCEWAGLPASAPVNLVSRSLARHPGRSHLSLGHF